MTKAEQNRLVRWRLKVLQFASEPRAIARACRRFGISRPTFYKWKKRHAEHGDAGLCDRPRTPLRSPSATPSEVVSKILYLRQNYHFGPRKIADYLRRFHQVSVAGATVHRILRKHGMNRLPAKRPYRFTTTAWTSSLLSEPVRESHRSPRPLFIANGPGDGLRPISVDSPRHSPRRALRPAHRNAPVAFQSPRRFCFAIQIRPERSGAERIRADQSGADRIPAVSHIQPKKSCRHAGGVPCFYLAPLRGGPGSSPA